MPVTILDKGKAKLFTQWIKSIIGSEPPVIEYDEYLEIDFTDEQVKLLKQYLNDQVRGAFLPSDKPPPKIQIKFGEVLIPWSIENLAPVIGASFGLGYLSKWAADKLRK